MAFVKRVNQVKKSVLLLSIFFIVFLFVSQRMKLLYFLLNMKSLSVLLLKQITTDLMAYNNDNIYIILQFCRSEAHWVSWAKIKVSVGLCSFLMSLEEIQLLCLSRG